MRLNDGDTVSFGNIKLEVLHTPGHTRGSLCFKAGQYLISGDTIFPGGPGKTRSPADLRRIIKSITDKIFVLPDDTQIYPGHGDSTILKKEKDEFAAHFDEMFDITVLPNKRCLASSNCNYILCFQTSYRYSRY